MLTDDLNFCLEKQMNPNDYTAHFLFDSEFVISFSLLFELVLEDYTMGSNHMTSCAPM